MTLFQLTAGQIETLLLIFVRIVAIFLVAPVFSSYRIPLLLKGGLCLLMAFLLRPLIPGAEAPSASFWVFTLLAAKEVIIGLVIGYVANLLFIAVQMAGEMQDTQAGFGLAGVVDPNMSQQSAIFGQFQMILIWLIFLVVNGHHLVLVAVADSFHALPPGMFTLSSELAPEMFGLATRLLVIALRLAAPIIAAMLLADIALGLMQKTSPQFNLFAVGFPAKIALSIVVMIITMPYTIGLQRNLVPFMEDIVYQLFAFAR
jgi:flagellar biosynthetic protein FliR